MADLVPVDYDPFASSDGPSLTPVDYDPFAGGDKPQLSLTPVDYDPFADAKREASRFPMPPPETNLRKLEQSSSAPGIAPLSSYSDQELMDIGANPGAATPAGAGARVAGFLAQGGARGMASFAGAMGSAIPTAIKYSPMGLLPGTDMVEAAGKRVANTADTIKKAIDQADLKPENLVERGASMFGQFAPTLAGAALTGGESTLAQLGSSGAFFGLPMGRDEYQSQLEQGKSPEVAAQHAAVQGLIATIGGKMLEGIASKLGPAVADSTASTIKTLAASAAEGYGFDVATHAGRAGVDVANNVPTTATLDFAAPTDKSEGGIFHTDWTMPLFSTLMRGVHVPGEIARRNVYDNTAVTPDGVLTRADGNGFSTPKTAEVFAKSNKIDSRLSDVGLSYEVVPVTDGKGYGIRFVKPMDEGNVPATPADVAEALRAAAPETERTQSSATETPEARTESPAFTSSDDILAQAIQHASSRVIPEEDLLSASRSAGRGAIPDSGLMEKARQEEEMWRNRANQAGDEQIASAESRNADIAKVGAPEDVMASDVRGSQLADALERAKTKQEEAPAMATVVDNLPRDRAITMAEAATKATGEPHTAIPNGKGAYRVVSLLDLHPTGEPSLSDRGGIPSQETAQEAPLQEGPVDRVSPAPLAEPERTKSQAEASAKIMTQAMGKDYIAVQRADGTYRVMPAQRESIKAPTADQIFPRESVRTEPSQPDLPKFGVREDGTTRTVAPPAEATGPYLRLEHDFQGDHPIAETYARMLNARADNEAGRYVAQDGRVSRVFADYSARDISDYLHQKMGPAASKIEVVKDAEELAKLRGKTVSTDNMSDGVYDPKTGKTYIVADKIHSLDRAVWVATHETAHKGLRTRDTQEYNRVIEMAKSNPTIRALADAIGKNDPASRSRTTHIEEAIAELHTAHQTGDYRHLESVYGVKANEASKGIVGRSLDVLNRVYSKALGRPIKTDELTSIIKNLHVDAEMGKLGHTGVGEQDLQSMFRRSPAGPTTAEKLGASEESLAENVQRRLQDNANRIAFRQKEVEDRGGVLTNATNIRRAITAVSGRSTAKFEKSAQELYKPLYTEMRKAKIGADDLSEYLRAKDKDARDRVVASRNDKFDLNAAKRNAEIQAFRSARDYSQYTKTEKEAIEAKIWHDNPPKVDPANPGSGMSAARQKEVLDKVAASGKQAAYDSLAKQVYKITEATRKNDVETGLRSQKEVDENLRLFGDTYVPQRGNEENDPTFTIKNESAKGRTSESANNLEQVLMQHEASIGYGEKNRVALATYNFAKAHPDAKLWEADPVDLMRYLDKNGRVKEEYRKQVQGDDIIHARVDGKDLYVRIKDPIMLRQLRNEGGLPTDHVLSAGTLPFSIANNFLRAPMTTYNPGFWLSNFVKDTHHALIVGAQYGPKFMGNVLKNIPSAIYEAGRAHGSGKQSQDYKDFNEAGGRTGFWASEQDMARRKKEVERYLKPAMSAGGVMRGFDQVSTVFRYLGETLEDATRLAAFKAAKAEGKSVAEAAEVAKGITLNFNQHGEAGTFMNRLWLFSNARMQGTAQMVQAMRKSPAVRALAIAEFVAFRALFAYFAQAAGKDPKTGKWLWDEIPEYEKANNVVIPAKLFRWALSEEQMKKTPYFKIPLPDGWRIIHNAAYATEMMSRLGKKAAPEAGRFMANSVINELVPAPAADMMKYEKDDGIVPTNQISNALPTAMRIPANLWQNKDDFGRDIHPTAKFGPKASSALVKPGTQGTMIDRATTWLNKNTGGNSVQGGKVDISPDSIIYLLDHLNPTVGPMISGIDKSTGSEPGIKNIPVVGQIAKRFIGEESAMNSQVRSDYFDNIKQVKNAAAQIASIAKPGGGEYKSSISQDERRAAAIKSIADQSSKMMTELAKQETVIRESTQPTPQKNLKLQAIEKKKQDLMEKFNGQFNRLAG